MIRCVCNVCSDSRLLVEIQFYRDEVFDFRT